ncbi:PREDICTED: uncharacterized protein LOC109209956 [Nicotiana attenuata]|uniref:uncharacterized protein LOC109209956 n=1 Tax=Nicotiana attenuata TaxID=49451 RepID=UPI0009055C81|nr:PREDICTED: uncharacterized protein LOC109209956 [Nicotiana attenuata]
MARQKRRAPQVYTPTITTKIPDPKPTQIQSPTQETEERDTQTESSHEQIQGSNPKVQLTVESAPKPDSDKLMRQITPASGVKQNLAPIQLASWLPGSSSQMEKRENQQAKNGEEGHVQPARKLTFATETHAMPTMAEVVKNNRTQTQGMKLNFYPPVIKDGIKVMQLNHQEIDKQKQKWQCALIGYVIGGTPKFKEMLQFVYGVWHSVKTPRVFLHDDGYYIFKFESEEDKACIMQNGPYTFRKWPMILKQWSPKFQLHKEPMRVLPIWVCFSGLPLLYWSEENLGRIASFLGKPMCTDILTAKGERISYEEY